ncbi:MAG: hypothetical protein NVSMB47_07610 [Polyangiales bacterium]
MRGLTIASLSAACALLVSLGALDAHGANAAIAASPSASPSANSASVGRPFSAHELDAAIARLGDPDAATRKAAALALVGTPADALSLLVVRMLRAPEAGPGPMWLALDKARKAGAKDESPGELLDAILGAGNGPGARSLSLLLAGIQACEREGGVAGARVLVELAVEHKGLLKTVVTASLKRLGDHAVAALIEARHDADRDLRGYANRMLDTLGKFLPSDAVQVKDPQDLADVLVAFGKLKDPDAIRVILSYLNADRVQVREAARWAIAQLGPEARLALKESFENFTGERAGDDWGAPKLLDALLTAYDKVRLADVYKLFDEGIAARDAGRLEDAVASFDALLARAPTFSRKAELAPTYVDLAHRQASKDRPAARMLLAKALRLAQGTPLAAPIDSELCFLDARDLYEHGVVDEAMLQRALELDPQNASARELLARVHGEAESRDDRLRRWAASASAGLLVAIAAVLFLGRRRAPKPPSTPRRPVRI